VDQSGGAHFRRELAAGSLGVADPREIRGHGNELCAMAFHRSGERAQTFVIARERKHAITCVSARRERTRERMSDPTGGPSHDPIHAGENSRRRPVIGIVFQV
jgi:hypothetical protein